MTILCGGPAATITATLTPITKTNITPSCTLQNINTSAIAGTVFVYTDNQLPLLYQCCSDRNGNPAAFAQMMQGYGALAVIIASYQTFMDGRVTGFNSGVSIPFVMVEESTIDIIKTQLPESVVLSTISQQESELLHRIEVAYLASVWTEAVLYSILALLLVYLISQEAVFLYYRNRQISHSMLAKITAACSTLLALIWIAIDPFNFRGYFHGASSFIWSLQFSLYACVFPMVLRIWIKAHNHKSLISRPSQILLWCMYGFIVVILSYSPINGFLWYYDAVTVLAVVLMVIQMCCGLGFIFYGGKMVLIFKRGRNQHDTLSIRIGAYVLLYIVTVIAFVSLAYVQVLGPIFTVLLSLYFQWFELFFTFLILFSHQRPIKKVGSGVMSSL